MAIKTRNTFKFRRFFGGRSINSPNSKGGWTEDDLREAVTLIQNNSLNIDTASVKFGMSRSTLYRAVHKKGIELPSKHNLFNRGGSTTIGNRKAKRDRHRRRRRPRVRHISEKLQSESKSLLSKMDNFDEAYSSDNEPQPESEYSRSEPSQSHNYTILSEIEEIVLEEKIIHLIKTCHLVTVPVVRRICFEYCQISGFNMENNDYQRYFNQNRKMASLEWFYDFLRRHPLIGVDGRGKIIVNTSGGGLKHRGKNYCIIIVPGFLYYSTYSGF